jgi:hypothetical protein
VDGAHDAATQCRGPPGSAAQGSPGTPPETQSRVPVTSCNDQAAAGRQVPQSLVKQIPDICNVLDDIDHRNDVKADLRRQLCESRREYRHPPLFRGSVAETYRPGFAVSGTGHGKMTELGTFRDCCHLTT